MFDCPKSPEELAAIFKKHARKSYEKCGLLGALCDKLQLRTECGKPEQDEASLRGDCAPVPNLCSAICYKYELYFELTMLIILLCLVQLDLLAKFIYTEVTGRQVKGTGRNVSAARTEAECKRYKTLSKWTKGQNHRR